MSTTNSLQAELATLKAAVKAHHDLLVEAQWQRTLAMEAAGVPVQYGRYVLDSSDEWRYPSVAEATRQVAALEDHDGYFWACSRVRDLEGLLGEGAPQLPLRTDDNYVPLYRGHVPAAHPSVAGFLMAA